MRATGNVNLATWQKMGFSKSSWYGIDSYVTPLGAKAGQGRDRVIESWPPRVMVQPIKKTTSAILWLALNGHLFKREQR